MGAEDEDRIIEDARFSLELTEMGPAIEAAIDTATESNDRQEVAKLFWEIGRMCLIKGEAIGINRFIDSVKAALEKKEEGQ